MVAWVVLTACALHAPDDVASAASVLLAADAGPAHPSLACAKCGTALRGSANCCSPGGEWEGMCDEGEGTRPHTWVDGYNACQQTDQRLTVSPVSTSNNASGAQEATAPATKPPPTATVLGSLTTVPGRADQVPTILAAFESVEPNFFRKGSFDAQNGLSLVSFHVVVDAVLPVPEWPVSLVNRTEERYPWARLTFKSEHNASRAIGQASSVNLIFRLLRDSGATYWLSAHLPIWPSALSA